MRRRAMPRRGSPRQLSGSIFLVVALGLLLGFGSRPAWSQPDEVRVRSLRVSSESYNVEPLDLLGAGGMVIRDSFDSL